MKTVITFIVTLALCTSVFSQNKDSGTKATNTLFTIDPLDHYITQITAASALLDLNEVGEAKKFLNSTDPHLRNSEWTYLKAKSDQSLFTLSGHKQGVVAIDVDPSSTLIATGSIDATIKIWSPKNQREIATLSGHSASVSTLDFSSDGKLLASGSRDKSVIVWDVATRTQKIKITEGLSQGIYNVRFSPDGKSILVCSWERNSKVSPPVAGFGKIFDVATGKEKTRIDMCPKPVTSGVFTPDGKKIILAGWDFNTICYEITTGKALWENNISNDPGYTAIQSLDLSPDGKKIVISGKDNRIRLLNAEDGKLIRLIDSVSLKRDINAVRFSPDGQFVISGAEDAFVKVWDVQSGKMVKSFRGHTGVLYAVAPLYAASEKNLLSASQDGTVKCWNLDGVHDISFTVCANGPWDMPVSADEKRIAASCSDKVINVWDISSGKITASFPGQSSNATAFTEDGKILVSGGHDQKVHVFDVNAQKEIRTLQSKGGLYGIAVSGINNLVAAVSESGFVQVWKLSDGTELKTLPFTEGGGASSLKFVAQKNWVIASSVKGAIKIWDIRDWTEVKTLSLGIPCANFYVNKEGTFLMAGSFNGSDEPLLYDLVKMEKRFSLSGHTAEVTALTLSPDGFRIITGSYDQTIRFWDVETGRCVYTMRNLPSVVYCIGFLRNSNKLIYSMTEGQIRLESMGKE